jgi:hypothetical protein
MRLIAVGAAWSKSGRNTSVVEVWASLAKHLKNGCLKEKQMDSRNTPRLGSD